jgi:predicted dehydrogenase
MKRTKNNRRDFIRKAAAGAAGMTIGAGAFGMTARSYSRIQGANDRIIVAIAGLGRRLSAYVEPIVKKDSNVELAYLCDVMRSQREKAAARFSKLLDYTPKLENDVRKVLADKKVDAVFNATPDHWHTPLACMTVQADKHAYIEKPCSHNPYEGELLVKFQDKYGKVMQMGVQQRSMPESIEIITEIHNGVIGEVYKAVAYYSDGRGEVPVPEKAPVPEGLDWDLFQGPRPRKPYMHNTWDYNWHWYGWDFGTAETGNNGTHELDVARWALQVEYPDQVFVEAAKRHFKNDGWEMFDTMDATFRFSGNKIIKWDGKSRNGQKTYNNGDRGTVIYGTEGTVNVNRNGYELFDRTGKSIRVRSARGKEAGNVPGGGGDMTTLHVVNFFNTIRGTDKLRAPIKEGVKSTHLDHLANITWRSNKQLLAVDPTNGRILDRDAMKFWKREYEPGWEPRFRIPFRISTG